MILTVLICYFIIFGRLICNDFFNIFGRFICNGLFQYVGRLILCLVCLLLPVSLNCLHPVSCVPIVDSVSGLSSSCVLCTYYCQCLWIVFILCLVYPLLPVSLDCLHPVSCVPIVYSVSGLSSSCVLCTHCC